MLNNNNLLNEKGREVVLSVSGSDSGEKNHWRYWSNWGGPVGTGEIQLQLHWDRSGNNYDHIYLRNITGIPRQVRIVNAIKKVERTFDLVSNGTNAFKCDYKLKSGEAHIANTGSKCTLKVYLIY
jgi:hypothetical protein